MTSSAAVPSRQARLVLALAAAVGLGLTLAATAPMGAASAQTTKPRSQVEDVPGAYIQLETVWLPVLNAAGRPTYLGIVVRLWPGPTTRYEACVAVPEVADQLLVHFNRQPMTREAYEDDKARDKQIMEVVVRTVGKGVFIKAESYRDFVIPDEESAILSATCK
jgi:hypothetical protein